MSDVFDFRIRTRADLVRAVEQFGFVPFFKNNIKVKVCFKFLSFGNTLHVVAIILLS